MYYSCFIFLQNRVGTPVYFSRNCQEVNSTWYSLEIEEPIKLCEKHYSLVLFILNYSIPRAWNWQRSIPSSPPPSPPSPPFPPGEMQKEGYSSPFQREVSSFHQSQQHACGLQTQKYAEYHLWLYTRLLRLWLDDIKAKQIMHMSSAIAPGVGAQANQGYYARNTRGCNRLFAPVGWGKFEGLFQNWGGAICKHNHGRKLQEYHRYIYPSDLGTLSHKTAPPLGENVSFAPCILQSPW